MPLLLNKIIDEHTSLAVWKIEEKEGFFEAHTHISSLIHHPHKRLQHLAGRYLLWLMQPAFPFEQIQINHARKPYLPNGQFHFSVSHCGDYAAAIISTDRQMGIDIELYSPKTGMVKHKFLSEKELLTLESLSSVFLLHQPHHEFGLYTLCWSAKEAVYKWWGEGGVDFKQHIKIQSIDADRNLITASFTKTLSPVHLVLQYQMLPHISLVWTATLKFP